MKRQAFRLAPVLELRRREERIAALAAAQAAAQAAAADERATAQEQALRTAAAPPSGDAGAFVNALLRGHMAVEDASAARALAAAQAEQSALVRSRWTAAAQRTKGLERLQERHAAALAHADDVAEIRTVDDLVTRQHADGVGDGRQHDGPDTDDEQEATWTA
ncbi:flagellar export protein FliJ [Goekera deserti]|uniref:flagellar export protein FliJ n=1 Tax=Goekera deserti TaxID=2497753 RepID=UPI001877C2EA|nr:flagellar export protein FliJ [Goekera deserti]